jgi:hypothetical protein
VAAYTIRLPPPSASETAQLQRANIDAKGVVRKALTIGIARDVPASEGAIRGDALQWSTTSDGGRAARIDIISPGAAGLRVAITMPGTAPEASVRCAGSAQPATIFGPYRAARVAEAVATHGAFWTPVLEGETASIELYVAQGTDPASVSLRVLQVSHLAVAGEALRHPSAKDAPG